jgi:hypothetical protein
MAGDCFTPDSRHSGAIVWAAATDPKRPPILLKPTSKKLYIARVGWKCV